MILYQHLEAAVHCTRRASLPAANAWCLPLGHVAFDLMFRVVTICNMCYFIYPGSNTEDLDTYFLLATCDTGSDLSADINRPGTFRLSLVITSRDVSESIIAQTGRLHFGQ